MDYKLTVRQAQNGFILSVDGDRAELFMDEEDLLIRLANVIIDPIYNKRIIKLNYVLNPTPPPKPEEQSFKEIEND